MKKLRLKTKCGTTIIELLIAITVFSMFFLIVLDYFKNTTRTASLNSWRAQAKQDLSRVIAILKLNFEKASYPSAVFPDGTVIYGASKPSDASAGDSDPTPAYYMRYFDGKILGKSTSNQKILEWKNCTPIYDSSLKNNMSKESWEKFQKYKAPETCTLVLGRNSYNVPTLYFKINNNTVCKVAGVKEIEVDGSVVKPAGYENYKTKKYSSGENKYNPWDDSGVIHLRIRLSSEFTHGTKYGSAGQAITEEKVTLRSAIKISPF